MDSYHISGGKKIEGSHRIPGAKNAVLPVLAASLISGKESEIHDCPRLSDVESMLRILNYSGCITKFRDGVITVDSSGVNRADIPESMMREMRSSIFLMGPMIARTGSVTLSQPGGCEIGLRPIDIHLKSLRKLGVDIHEEDGLLLCRADSLIGTEIRLDFPSVGATENIMMAATAAEGETILLNAAREPEIVNLQNFLNSMGAKISGAGTHRITISGKTVWHNTKFRIIPDRIEAGTVMAAAAVTGGNVILEGAMSDDMKHITEVFRLSGCIVKEEVGFMEIKAPVRLSAVKGIVTKPYPGFPTDMQPQFAAMMTFANGESSIRETIFDNRFRYAAELNKMGAITRTEGDKLIIEGRESLYGSEMYAHDLRGGAALTIAALGACGDSIVHGISYIDRGYEALENTLKSLGADIMRINSE